MKDPFVWKRNPEDQEVAHIVFDGQVIDVAPSVQQVTIEYERESIESKS